MSPSGPPCQRRNQPTDPGGLERAHPASAKIHPLVYEINARSWLEELTQQHGFRITLRNLPESVFAAWQKLGFTHIWLMGVWRTGPLTRKSAVTNWKRYWSNEDPFAPKQAEHIVASPYAISGYKVCKSIGGPDGLSVFRGQLAKHGLKLLLDFIPNHVGLDHAWLKSRPDLFIQAPSMRPGMFRRRAGGKWTFFAHGKDPYFPAWTDTAQLDYRRSATRELMKKELKRLAALCDGVRCDMAMLVLNDVFERNWGALRLAERAPQEEFWKDAILSIKREARDFLFLAEAYWGLEGQLQQLGFDYVYNKGLYDLLVSRRSGDLQDHLHQRGTEFLNRGAHFLENHDEPRAASLFAANEHPAAAFLILSTPGLRLLHHGQLSGARKRTKVQYRHCTSEEVDHSVSEIYQKFLTILTQSSVGRGEPQILKLARSSPGNESFRHVIATWWMNGTHRDLAIVNLAPHRSQCVLRLPELAPAGTYTMRDLLGHEFYERNAGDSKHGLYFDLDAHAAQLFRFEAVSLARP